MVLVGVGLIIIFFVAILFITLKHSKNDIKLEVAATCEGKNELEQTIMRVYFTFSIGKLANRKKEIIGSIEWSDGWKPISYNLKEHGVYHEEQLLTPTKEDTYASFEIDATNTVDEQGRGEGYVVLVLENPTDAASFRAGIILAVTANMVTYQLSDSTSWKNEFVVNH